MLDELVTNVRQVPARTDLIREGDKPSNVYLVMGLRLPLQSFAGR